jgi:hypothetical protein
MGRQFAAAFIVIGYRREEPGKCETRKAELDPSMPRLPSSGGYDVTSRRDKERARVFGRCELRIKGGKFMRIITLTVILGLPLMAVGQTGNPEQTQGQSNETQTTAPAKGKKEARPAQETSKTKTKPETSTNVRGKTDVKSRTQDVNETQAGARSSTSSETNVSGSSQKTTTTAVNKEEFRSRHSEVFSLGRHPKEFFIQRFGESHFRLIGNSYFVFVDGCWVAVDVDGFTYTQRIICEGDPDFVVVD